MADISKIAIAGTTYNIKDATAREGMVSFPTSGTPAALGTASHGTAETVARSDHVHTKPTYGNLTTAGAITSTAAIANGDKLVIVDSSASSKLTGSTITFDGSTTNTFLSRKGTWERAVGVPDGGTTGQLLVKNSDTDGDAGWYSIMEIPTDKWYLPTGIQESQVIAAYQFIGAQSEAKALLNINSGTQYSLSKSSSQVTWNASYGFLIPAVKAQGLSQATLKANPTNIYSVVMGVRHDGSWATENGYTYAPCVSFGTARTDKKGISIRRGGNITFNTKPTIVNQLDGGYSGTTIAKGVLGGNFSSTNAIYVNGSSQSLTVFSGDSAAPSLIDNLVIGTVNYDAGQNSAYVTAFAIYKTTLTAAQHIELSNSITSLGGL